MFSFYYKHKIFSVAILTLVVCNGLLAFVFVTKQSSHLSEIKGVRDRVVPIQLQQPPTEQDQPQPDYIPKLIQEDKASSDESQLEQVQLVGAGCSDATLFPSACELLIGANTMLLKECSEEHLEHCNLYTYTLGKTTQNSVFVLRTYSENGDILLDILRVGFDRSGYQVIETHLFEPLSHPMTPSQQARLDLIVQKNEAYQKALSEYSK